MAYVAPTNQATGDVITAAIWNQNVVSNPIAIYAGAMSVTAQAANDLIYATSATQWTRVAGAASAILVTSAGNVPSLSTTVPAHAVTTSVTVPLVIGGSGTTQTLTFKTTTGVGATGADHIFVVGNNGATEAMRIVNSGFVGMGGTTSPAVRLDFGTSVANSKIIIGTYISGNFWTGIGMAAASAGVRIAGDSSGGSLLDIGYYSNDASHNWTSAVAIDGSGNVGIGMTAVKTCDVTGTMRITGTVDGTFIATYNAATSVLAYFTQTGTSDCQVRLQRTGGTTSAWDLVVPSGSTRMYIGNAGELFSFFTTGNLKIGGTANRGTTEGTNELVIFNGTAPAGTLSNGASFFCAAGEMKVIDSSGNVTLLSPHDRQTNEWIYLSQDTRTGEVLRIEIERLVDEVERLSGRSFTTRWRDEVGTTNQRPAM